MQCVRSTSHSFILSLIFNYSSVRQETSRRLFGPCWNRPKNFKKASDNGALGEHPKATSTTSSSESAPTSKLPPTPSLTTALILGASFAVPHVFDLLTDTDIDSHIGNFIEDLRGALETCLSEHPSPEALNDNIPRIRNVIYTLLKGLQARQAAWQAASGRESYMS